LCKGNLSQVAAEVIEVDGNFLLRLRMYYIPFSSKISSEGVWGDVSEMQVKKRDTYSHSYNRLDLRNTLQCVWDTARQEFCLTKFGQYARMIQNYRRSREELYYVRGFLLTIPKRNHR
jgi:hypothetical protein